MAEFDDKYSTTTNNRVGESGLIIVARTSKNELGYSNSGGRRRDPGKLHNVGK